MNSADYGSIQVKSAEMLAVLSNLQNLKPTNLVFIVGSKGSGKTTLAEFINQSVFKNSIVPISDHFQKNSDGGIFTLSNSEWLDIFEELNPESFQLILMPNLEERRLDLANLADFFLQVLSLMHNKPKAKLTEKALEKILQYKWPGQFYEFEAVLENAFIKVENGLLEPEFLVMGPLQTDVGVPTGMKLEELERKYILQTLYFVHQNRTKAAEILGISIRTLRNKINQYRVEGHL